MKLSRKLILICFVIAPIVIHFCFLTSTIINFPTWGDDFLFFELIEHLQKDSSWGFIQFLFKPHNYIHLVVFGKLLVLMEYFILESLQLKWIIIYANLLLLGISFTFYRYLKIQQYSLEYLIPIVCFLFAPFASIDNYNLIGVVTHTASLLFLTLIANLVAKRRQSLTLLLLLGIYPLVATEGWGMLPLMGIYMFITHHPMKKSVLVMSVFALAGLGYLIIQQPTSTASSSFVQLLIQSPLALLTFLGNIAWPLSDTYKIAINTTIGGSLLIISLWSMWNNRNNRSTWEFPVIIWLQVLLTGTMICIGRSQGSTIATLVLSERFYSYSSFAGIACYLMLVPIMKRSAKNKMFIIISSMIYYLGSCYYFFSNQSQLRNRLLADLTNAYQQSASTSYPVESSPLRSMVHAPFYKVLSGDLLSLQIPKNSLFKPIQVIIEKHSIGQFSLKFPAIPEKNSPREQRWLAIQSITHPDSTFFVAFVSDKAHKPKIIRINSLQLTDLNQKNFWLYSKSEDGQEKAIYLGSLK